MEIQSRDKCCQPVLQTFQRIAQSVNIAIDRLTAMGEKIADKNCDIRQEMYEACKEARNAGTSIERMCDIMATDTLESSSSNGSLSLRNIIKNANKSLIGPITRVLLLADIVVVKQLLISRDKISKSTDKLESVLNFTEFVKAFFVFGGDMVDLANLMGDRPSKFIAERRRAQILIAKKVVEHSTAILFTSSKTCLLHPECPITKENRDTVFCQIRRAMDFIHFIIKDGVNDTAFNLTKIPQTPINDWATEKENLYFALIYFSRLMNLYKQKIVDIKENLSCERNVLNAENLQQSIDKEQFTLSSQIYRSCNINNENNYIIDDEGSKASEKLYKSNPVTREILLVAMGVVIERTDDFTDSAYTNQETREKIILLRSKCKLELEKCLTLAYNCDKKNLKNISKLDEASERVLIAINDLSAQIIISVNDQMFDLNHSLCMTVGMLINFRSYAINQELDRLHGSIRFFHNYCDHVLDVCKLFQHIAAKESYQVKAKFLESNMRLYGPQVINAARIISIYPTSKVAHENFDAFLTMWRWLSSEIMILCEEIIDLTQRQAHSNESDYLKLSSPWNQTVNKKPVSCTWMAKDGPQKTGNAEHNMKMISNELEEKSDNWLNDTSENNDIIKRAKNMSSMAFLMYQFTNGNGVLRTTQDLFTQAEYFAEEANRLYKVVRQFSYQVPAGKFKKDLLDLLDKVPTYVQALQFTVKDHTVGKAATFVKVDQVIRETKNLMNAINKVTTACFECANKYKLNFSELAGRSLSGYPRDGESGAVAMGESKGTSNITEGSM